MTRAAGLGRVRRAALALGLLAAALCLTAGGGRAASPKAPAVLKAEEGATVTGKLRPGVTAEYAIALEEGQYLELHLDRSPYELMAYLYGPGVEPTGGKRGAVTWSELALDVEGQMVWELAQASGVHRLLLEPKADAPLAYRLLIAALRPANAQDQARQRSDEQFAEGESLLENGKLEEAVAIFSANLENCREGRYTRGEASNLILRGRGLTHLGRFDEARQDLNAALAIWESLGETSAIGVTKVSLGNLERRLAHWDLALGLAEQGLRLAGDSGAQDVIGNALDLECRIYIEQGHSDHALDVCGRAVAHWDEIDAPEESTDALLNLGYIYWSLGELQAAREVYDRIEAILDEHPDPGTAANLLIHLAVLDETRGEYQKALEGYQEASEALTAVSLFSQAGVAVQNMGEIHHYRLRNLDTALNYYRHALKLLERASDPLDRIPVLQSLGNLYLDRGDAVEARRALEEALALSREAQAAPYLRGTLLILGRLRLAEKRPNEARTSFEEALSLSRMTGNPWSEADALAGLGGALVLLGEEQQGLVLLREAAAISQEIGDRTGHAESHYSIAEIERSRGNLDAARWAAKAALGVMDEIRGVMGSAELKTLFSATARRYQELYIDVLMAQHENHPEAGHDLEALSASEEARARSLLEILVEADLSPGAEVPEELLRERTGFLERLDAAALRRQLLLEAKAGTEPLRNVELELERLLTRLREVERRIRAASPRYATLTQPSPVEVQDIQRSILDPDTALLEYFLGEERSFLWVVRKDGLRTYELPPRSDIDRDARCLHWLITAYGELPAVDSLEPEDIDCLADGLEDYREAQEEGHPLRRRGGQKRAIEGAFQALARDLSETLLGPPAQDGLLPFRLAIVSDGALEYVPFAALPDPAADGQPMVRAHEIVRQPSASVLALQRGKPLPADTSTGTLAIVADPVYELQDDRITRSLRRTKQDGAADLARAKEPLPRPYPRLDYTREEAQAIAAFAPEDRTFIAMDHRASRETVQSGALSGYRYVHFATHGTLDTRFPELSSLVLSLVDENGNPRSDGFLRLNDIYGLDLDGTDMVVLSACETALGKEVRGEGLIGLTRGFQYAGARRVLSSLWRVQDRPTARLMENLYRGLLQEGRSPADSLRRAQLAVLDEAGGRSEFPYYWAGFVLQGEWR